ncbi:MAG: translational GTPase TypA [Firmicutes bacterium]|nr:translational GTPase TypA [Bacillota bacterium]
MKDDRKIRNIAIIAHVDHGKTTLVDALLKQGLVFRDNQATTDRMMDSNAIERERGITILAKNASFFYKTVKGDEIKVNVVDTPGHADFGGEVERVLKMVDGVLLVVDSYEGTMPQTRFVLSKALELNHKVIVVVNKIDRQDARVKEVVDEVLELLMDLGATDEQLNSPIVYASARSGVSTLDMKTEAKDMQPLFETIVSHITPPQGDKNKKFNMLISATEHSDYLGKMAIGKIEAGIVKVGDWVTITNYHNKETNQKTKVTGIFEFAGMKAVQVEQASAGDIVKIGLNHPPSIGDTLSNPEEIACIPFVKISEPSVEMTFMVNDSPFAGKEGKFVTSRHIRDRLYKETAKDLSLRVKDGETTESFKVAGRGEMHLSILIENMRREGYEFMVSQPTVLPKIIDGVTHEPIDELVVDVPAEAVGAVMSLMGERKGELVSMNPIGDRMKVTFKVPSRGLFGFRGTFLTLTRGEGIMASIFDSYQPLKGEIDRRMQGSLVAFETGETTQFAMFGVQDRGEFIVAPGEQVYAGMVVGINNKNEDLEVNVCKKKNLTNMRTAGSEDSTKVSPKKNLSLEAAIEFIADDELLEVTPQNIRIRKKYLDHNVRKRMVKAAKEK